MADEGADWVVKVLHAELEPGEMLQWSGRPALGTALLRLVPATAFMAVWMGGVSYEVATGLGRALTDGVVGSGLAIPLVMLALGCIFVWGVLNQVVAAFRTAYGVTNRRILVVEAGFRRRVKSWRPTQITVVERRDRGGGRGDITFHRSERAGGEGLVIEALADIPEAKVVEGYVRRLAFSF